MCMFFQCESGDKEAKLQERLKEVAMTLEKVNKNADLRQKQSLELANQLKNTNWLVNVYLSCWYLNFITLLQVESFQSWMLICKRDQTT